MEDEDKECDGRSRSVEDVECAPFDPLRTRSLEPITATGVDGGVNPRKSAQGEKLARRLPSNYSRQTGWVAKPVNAVSRRKAGPKASITGVCRPVTIDDRDWWLLDRFSFSTAVCKLTNATDCAPDLRGFSPPTPGVAAITRAAFEADLLREGYEVRAGSLEPNLTVKRTPTGSMRACSCGKDPSRSSSEGTGTYGPGNSCSFPAGTMHEEHTEADGARYVAGRRSAAEAAGAQ